MKKIIIKGFILLILVSAGNILVLKWINPNFYWGDVNFKKKYQDYSENYSDSNLIFLGTSRIYRGVDPILFETQVSDDLNISSFNFGVTGMIPPYSYFVLEEILKEPFPTLKYVIMEMESVGVMEKTKSYYFMNWAHYFFAIKVILDSKIDYGLRIIWKLSIQYIRSLMNHDLMTSALESDSWNNQELTKRTNFKGYLAIDDDYKIYGSNNLLARRNAFDSTVISKRRMTNIPNQELYLQPNPIHLERMQSLIKLAADKGIRLVFMLGPRSSFDYLEMKSIFDKLDSKNKIDLSNSAKYSELYFPQHYWDNGHYNKLGSMFFTSGLAKEFSLLLEKYPE